MVFRHTTLVTAPVPKSTSFVIRFINCIYVPCMFLRHTLVLPWSFSRPSVCYSHTYRSPFHLVVVQWMQHVALSMNATTQLTASVLLSPQRRRLPIHLFSMDLAPYTVPWEPMVGNDATQTKWMPLIAPAVYDLHCKGSCIVPIQRRSLQTNIGTGMFWGSSPMTMV